MDPHEADGSSPSALRAPPALATEQPPAIIGVDLGASGVRVAVVDDGAARPLTLGGADPFPTAVALSTADEPVVGAHAELLLRTAPERTLPLRVLLPNMVRPAPADSADGLLTRLARPEVLDLFLRRVLEEVHRALGIPLGGIVVSVPTELAAVERAALAAAVGRAAPQAQVWVVGELGAAAVAFAHGRGLARKRLLLLDLGAQTLAIGLAQLTGNDAELLAAASHPALGGDQFDRRLASTIAAALAPAQREALESSAAGREQLRRGAERAKIALDGQSSVPIDLPGLASAAFELTLSQLEAATADLVEGVVARAKEMLASAGMSEHHLDGVVLIGRQGRSAALRRRLCEALSVSLYDDAALAHAIALGAALHGQALAARRRGFPAASLSEVLAAPIGIGTVSGKLQKVLDRGLRLPARKNLTVRVQPGTRFGVAVYQGLAEQAEDNALLGTFEAKMHHAGEATLTFFAAADGRLEVSFAAPGEPSRQVELSLTTHAPEARAALSVGWGSAVEPPPPRGLFDHVRRLLRRD